MVRKGLLERIERFYHQLEEEKIDQDKAYLKEQLREKDSAINDQLEGIRELSSSCLEKSEIHELMKKADEELTAAKEIEEELDEKFSIFVIGNGNSGKSTLVNALVGQEAAEMSAIPKTWKIDVFHQGEGRLAEVISQTEDGRVKQIVEAEEAKRIIEDEDSKRTASLEEIESILEDKMVQIEALAKQKNLTPTQQLALEEQYRQKLYTEKLYISPVTEVRWPLKEEGLLRHFQVVDTPGLTQNLNGLTVNDSIKEYYRKADGILCVLDINKVADESIMSLIKKVEAELEAEGIAGDSERTLGILNRCDHIREEDQVKSLVQQAKQLYEEHFQEMLPLSAKKALEGKLYEKQELLEASGYEALETYINEHFLYESSSIKMRKRVHLLRLAQEQLKESVITYKKVLETKDAQRKRIGEKLEKDIKELTQLTHQRINALIVTYKEKVAEHIEEWVPKLFESNFNKEQKIEHAIFQVAHLNEMIQDLVEVLSEEIKQIERVFRELIGLNESNPAAIQRADFELGYDLELDHESEVRTGPQAIRSNQNIDNAEAIEFSGQIETVKETQNNEYIEIAENIMDSKGIEVNENARHSERIEIIENPMNGECTEMAEDTESIKNAEMNKTTESIDNAKNIVAEAGLLNQERPEIRLNLDEMKVSTLLEQGWLQFLNKYQVVKKLLKLTRGQTCRKELIAHLEQMTASLEEELNQVLIREIESLSVRMMQLGEEYFKSFYGSSEALESQLQALNALEEILRRGYKEKTIIDYIKGERAAWK